MGTLNHIPQKCTFFESFYHLTHYEGYENLMEAVDIATNDAELTTDLVLDALQEVENRKYKALHMTKDSAVMSWFKVYGKALANTIKSTYHK